MSTYNQMTKNPKTEQFEEATWHDDYFGPNHYGVEFPDGSILDPVRTQLETREYTAEERIPQLEALADRQQQTIRELSQAFRELTAELTRIKNVLASFRVILGD